jgi:DNA-binding MarR family transcriptional regulator
MENELLISPEALDIVHAYLRNGSDTEKAAESLGLPTHVVADHLAKKECMRYIDRVFVESGYRNRETLAGVWEAVIATKLEEMQESGMGSSKDIVEILEKFHKFKMEELKLMKDMDPKIQVNQQNNFGDGYSGLMEKILNAGQ